MTTATEIQILQYKVNQSVKPGALEGLSEKLLEQHWKLYEGYVTNSNFLNNAIWEALKSGGEVNKPNLAELQRRFGFEYNGMVLHEYYFAGMKKGVKEPSVASPVISTLASNYGSLENWKKQFMEIGKMRGIGWVITYLDPLAQRLVNVWVSDHEVGNIAGFIPVVVMDCWEHAYVTDFGASANGRVEYIQTFFKNFNWNIVQERLEGAFRGNIISRIKA